MLVSARYKDPSKVLKNLVALCVLSIVSGQDSSGSSRIDFEALSFLTHKNLDEASSSNKPFGGRRLKQIASEVEDTWALAEEVEDVYFNGVESPSSFDMDLGVSSPFFPFLLCSSSAKGEKEKSGYQRLVTLAKRINSSADSVESAKVWSDFGKNDISTAGTNSPVHPMYNKDGKTCVSFRSLASEAKETSTFSDGKMTEFQGEEMVVVPVTASMKIHDGTFEVMESKFSTPQLDVFGKYDESSQTRPIKLGVQLSPGTGDGSIETVNVYANKILGFSKLLASKYNVDGNVRRRHRNLRSQAGSGNLAKKPSFIQMSNKERMESEITSNIWSSSKRELQSSGSCSASLQNMSYKAYSLGHSFDVEISPNLSISEEETKRCLRLFVEAVSQQPEVFSVAAFPEFQTFNANANKFIQGGSDATAPKPFHDLGYTGEGQVITVSDTGCDQDNCYFSDPSGPVPTDGSVDTSKRVVIQYYISGGNGEDESNGHGTHVAGTAAGNAEGGEVDGVASGAKLSICDIGTGGSSLSPSSDMDVLFAPGHKEAGAKLHSGSWGAGGWLGAYHMYCERFDEYAHREQDFLVIMAAGNSGAGGVSWPGTSKNIITVGATQNSEDAKLSLASFSGRGVVNGGRSKPEIVAPGAAVASARSQGECDSPLSMQGTSMATPAVSGSAAIIRQYLIRNGLANPNGSLVKSLLLNSGQPIETGVPYDSVQNFGLINMMRVLPLQGNNELDLLVLNGVTIDDGETNKVSITINDRNGKCTDPLSVTLVWTDPVGESLMNNLDLTMNDSSSTTYYPNGLTTNDNVNNAERIRIDYGLANGDSYDINVAAATLIESSVKYSLAISGCFDPPDAVDINPPDAVETLARYISNGSNPNQSPKQPVTPPSPKQPVTPPSPTMQPVSTPSPTMQPVSTPSPTMQPVTPPSLKPSFSPTPFPVSPPREKGNKEKAPKDKRRR